MIWKRCSAEVWPSPPLAVTLTKHAKHATKLHILTLKVFRFEACINNNILLLLIRV